VPKRQKTVKVKPINGLQGAGLRDLARYGVQPDGVEGRGPQVQE
jgi:hypothetical protein